ncbi:MAG: hypothetical protein HOC28_07980, partial [Bacteroidetes Order II. Incertae sedis bacterium]|nr:hypothetical protein [Bacteroidetes Order II. bacterium]
MRTLTLLLLFLMIASPAVSQDKLTFYGDFRGRVELDRNSDKSDGTTRDNRDRMRIRARFGLNYAHSNRVTLGMRIRTGDPASIQSPHITLGDGLSTKPIALDRVFARVTFDGGSVWFGKNSNPFWHQNELFWDDDVMLEGAAATYRLHDKVEARLGYFVLDTPSSNSFADQAKMLGGQLIASQGILTAAIGIQSIRENPDAVDTRLSDVDYTLVSGSMYADLRFNDRPVRVGLDIISNLENYDQVMYNHDQTSGFVASARYGSANKTGDWQFRYYFSYIQKYAVVGAFAQDDWVRWGSATSTRSSNFWGHEVRAVYVPGEGQNLVLRAYLVEALELESTGASAL